ncbi:polyprotein [Operophtera brumata]|uniref:Polyprotein n=1 Tax=Operophtera brumata TaxID=104452 RepID=A0A0L7L4A5_OPEBR|nr:polyprotein [Operophtera brumata]
MLFGKLPEFELEDGRNWSSYVRLVRQFILLNEIKTELRVATLVTHVGARTYQLLCDLCAPNHPEDKTFDQLVVLVAGHLEPKRSEIAERHMFRQRRQEEGESISTFLQSLKHLATHCNFGATLEVDLRDQLVSGLRSEDMRSRLFAESSLDYKKAVELALALEAAERHAAEAVAGAALWATAGASGLGQGAAVAGLHRVAQGPPAATGPRGACWRCGKTRHAPNKCRYKSFVCDKCNVEGHLAVMCSKNRKDPPESRYQNFINKDSSSDSDSSDGLYKLVSVNSDSKDGPYNYTLSIENTKVLFEIDTGSRISAVSKSFYDKHLSYLPTTSDGNKFHSYTGEAIVTLGRVTVKVTCRDVTLPLPLFIVNNGGPPLLGRQWLRKLKLNSINVHHLSAEDDSEVDKLKLDFPDVFNVFKSGHDSCKTKVKLFVKDDMPMFCKARPLPLALRDPVEQELERLQREQD